MTPMNESLMKADQIGRLRYTSEQKQTMVDPKKENGRVLGAPLCEVLDCAPGGG